MNESFLRLPAVKITTGLGRSQIYEMIKGGTFPAPVKLTRRAVGWLQSEVQRWIEARKAERDRN